MQGLELLYKPRYREHCEMKSNSTQIPFAFTHLFATVFNPQRSQLLQIQNGLLYHIQVCKHFTSRAFDLHIDAILAQVCGESQSESIRSSSHSFAAIVISSPVDHLRTTYLQSDYIDNTFNQYRLCYAGEIEILKAQPWVWHSLNAYCYLRMFCCSQCLSRRRENAANSAMEPIQGFELAQIVRISRRWHIRKRLTVTSVCVERILCVENNHDLWE